MSDRPRLEAKDGVVVGTTAEGVDRFLGVPYAHVRRFAPPRGVEPWSEARDGSKPGPAAPQPLRKMAQFTHGPLPPTDEQSLSLNIWRPGGGDPKPALVWIHGGGFTMGWGSASLYDGHRLARATGAVVITVNYRLGSLGWLCHPLLGDHEGGPTGNWGLLDQQAALRWVRDNAEALGVDPRQVTLAGQSAGASCVMCHMSSPGSEGLFARAVLQSPIMSGAGGPLELAHRWADALFRRAGDGNARAGLTALRQADAKTIVAWHEELLRSEEFHGVSGAQPTVEPATIPVAPSEAAGIAPGVDLLAGTTTEEARFFFLARQAEDAEPDESTLRAVLAHDPSINDANGLIATARDAARISGSTWGPAEHVALATREMFEAPLDRWVAERRAAGARVFQYRLAHPGPYGALHTADVPLLFGTYDDGDIGARMVGATGASERSSAAMMRAWGAFMRGDGPGWSDDGTYGIGV